jgi:hypothetical protein
MVSALSGDIPEEIESVAPPHCGPRQPNQNIHAAGILRLRSRSDRAILIPAREIKPEEHEKRCGPDERRP